MNLHCCSVTNSRPALCDSMDCSTPGFLSFPISQCLLKPKSMESVMPSNHLILGFLFLSAAIFHSIRVFSNESSLCIRGPMYWSFSYIISPSNEYLVLISFRTDWFDLVVQRTFKSSPSTTAWKHQFFGAQPSLWSNSHIHLWLLEILYLCL